MPTNTAIPRKKRKNPTVFYKQRLALRTVEENVNMFSAENITSANKASKVLRSFFDTDTLEYTESFNVLYLNAAYAPICWANISEGGIAGCIVDIRVVFAHAVLCGASAIMLSHNHPSGNLTPSQADIDVTRRIKKAGESMDVVLLDHIIITKDSYYSFADEGMLY